MIVRAVLARILGLPPLVAARLVLDAYGRAAGGLLANGLAFSALFAAIPATLLVLGLAGWVAAGDPMIRERASQALATALPPLADLIRGSVDAVAGGAVLTSAIGVIGLVWTTSQLFGALDVAFARIFFEQPERDLLRRTIRGLIVVGLLAAMVVVTIAIVAVLAMVDALRGTQGSLAGGAVSLLGSPLFLGFVASLGVMVGYRNLPPTPPRWRALVIPAVIVAVVVVMLGQAFTLLVPWLVSVADLAGSLASGFVALAWLSFSFQALLLGAAWVRVRNAGSASLDGPAAPAEPGGRRE